MKLLLVKTSSLGDVVHTMPAITEAVAKYPQLTLDWAVEETFVPVARLHPGVRQVLPVAVRRWRHSLLRSATEVRALRATLRQEAYDCVIDSQGLLKSAMLARLAQAQLHGFDRHSAREGLASRFYHQSHPVPRDRHAIQRQKALFASVLGYEADAAIDYGLAPAAADASASSHGHKGRIALLHGTSWLSKEWPESYWQSLAAAIAQDGYTLDIPAGNPIEAERAHRILGSLPGRVLEMRHLSEVIQCLGQATGAVSMDTGLGHLAAALGLPLVAIFGATSTRLAGVTGTRAANLDADHLPCIPCLQRKCRFPKQAHSSNIYPPCYEKTTPEKVWRTLSRLLSQPAPN